MGVEYYKGKPIPLFESVKFNKETGYGLSASEDWKSYLLYEFKDHSVVPRLKIWCGIKKVDSLFSRIP